MVASIFAFLAATDAKFTRVPGHEESEPLMPGMKSLMVVSEGTGELLSTGVVTMVVLPTVAAILYVLGYRVAGPMVALFALGLFLARIFGAQT